VREVHWLEEMGTAQALWVLEVESFGPFLVGSDLAGNSLFETSNRQLGASIGKAYQGLKLPVMRRYG